MDENIIIPVLGILCAIALPLILVILSVYWTVTSKHKEKMAMIEIVAMIVVCGGIAFTSYFFISKKLMEQEEKNSIDRF